jgi:hypothetical protein
MKHFICRKLVQQEKQCIYISLAHTYMTQYIANIFQNVLFISEPE